MSDLIETNTNLEWNVSRTLAQINYRIHTESIKANIVPNLEVSPKTKHFLYANEADMLNLALFGKTASDWRNNYRRQKAGAIKNAINLRFWGV